jgi:homoserine kinase type II
LTLGDRDEAGSEGRERRCGGLCGEQWLYVQFAPAEPYLAPFSRDALRQYGKSARSMAVLTPVELADAARIGREYGLSIIALRGILAGSVNTNFECSLEGGDHVFLRVYEEQDAPGAAREIKLLEHLASRGVPTVRPLFRRAAGDTDEQTLSSYSGKAAALFPWVDGEILCQKRVSESVMAQVGKALAQIHVAGADFVGAQHSRFDAAHLTGRLERLRIQGYGQLPASGTAVGGAAANGAVVGGAAAGGAVPGGEIGADVERLAEKLAAYVERERRRGGPPPSALVHGDVFRDNVLWKDGQMVAVLDFESASLGSVTFDLCVTMLAWCYGDVLERDLARALVRGYSAERALTAEDRERLFDDAMFAALRFSITRITDYELRPKGTGVYKNYRRFLGRLATIEGLGAKGLAEFMGIEG